MSEKQNQKNKAFNYIPPTFGDYVTREQQAFQSAKLRKLIRDSQIRLGVIPPADENQKD